MTLPELFEKLLAWREAEKEAADLRMELELHPTTTEEMRKRWQTASYTAHGKMWNVLRAVDAYLAAHPGGTDPACECPACRLGTGRGPKENTP